jgi:hypothetical protein
MGVVAMEGTSVPVDMGAEPDARATTTVPPKDPLTKAMRSLRRWTVALTVIVTVSAIAAAAWTGWGAYQDWLDGQEVDIGADSAPIQPLKDLVTRTYGGDLASVDVYQVALWWDPSYSTVPDRPYAVTYRLAGSGITVSGLVDSVDVFDACGLAPTIGSLDSQLTMGELRTLALEWKKRSNKPMGIMYAYTSSYSDEGWSAGDKITVDGKEYLVDHLWCVNEGWVPAPGVDTRWEQVPKVRAMVFLRDRKTGKFTYIGSEPAQVPVYSSSEGDC